MHVDVDHDLRPYFGEARDQGPRPTCLSFAMSDSHAAMRQGWLPLSCEYLHYYAVGRDGAGPNDAATLSAVLAALREDGQPEETAWPYIMQPVVDAAKWVAPKGAVVFKCDGAEQSASVAAVVELISKRRAAIAAIRLSDGFFTPVNGVVDGFDPVPDPRLHAVVAVAIGHVGNRRFVLVRNSWGQAWGVNGHAWLSESYLAPRLIAVAAFGEVS